MSDDAATKLRKKMQLREQLLGSKPKRAEETTDLTDAEKEQMQRLREREVELERGIERLDKGLSRVRMMMMLTSGRDGGFNASAPDAPAEKPQKRSE